MQTKKLGLAIFGLAIMLWQAPAFSQSFEFPSNFTPPWSVPSGCLVLTPGILEPPSAVFYDETVSVDDGILGATSVRIQAWRIGCHEPGRSAIAVNFQVPMSPITTLSVPVAFLRANGLGSPVIAFLGLFSSLQATSAIQSLGGRSLRAIANLSTFAEGVTYVVLGTSPGITANEYNDSIDLILDFGFNQEVAIPIFSYIPELDSPQLPLATFHGRYSGQWTLEDDLPRSGLLLQIGEIPGTTRNFMFAIWFTYLNGFPTWVTGNTDFEIGANEIELDMITVEGGEFFTQPGSFTNNDMDVTQVGTMTIRANHCNEIEADNDFTISGLGTSSLTFGRLIRIAGYDCDQTQ